jgi:hypothetical protein
MKTFRNHIKHTIFLKMAFDTKDMKHIGHQCYKCSHSLYNYEIFALTYISYGKIFRIRPLKILAATEASYCDRL